MGAQLPPGFVLDQKPNALPPGFVLDPPMVPGGTIVEPPAPKPDLGPMQREDFGPGAGTGEMDRGAMGLGLPGEETPMFLASDSNTMQAGAQGFGRSIADLLGAVPDIAGAIYNLPAGVLNDVSASKGGGRPFPTIDPMADRVANASGDIAAAFGFPTRDPAEMPFNDKLIYNAARFGAGGGEVGGALAAASKARMASAGPRIGRAPKMFDSLLAPYEEAPGAAIAQDIGAGIGSGTALTALNTAGSDDPLAELAAMFVGGVGGATGVKAGMSPGAVPRMIRDQMVAPEMPYVKIGDTAVPIQNKTADRAARFYQGNLSDPKQHAADITTNAAEYKNAGMPMPTVAGLSNDLGAIFLENGARTREPRPFAENDAALRTAATKELAGVRPDVPESAARLPQEVAKEQALAEVAAAEAAAQQARDKVTTAQRQFDTAAGQDAEIVGPYRSTEAAADQAAASTRIDKNIVEGTLAPKTAEKNAAFEAADPEGTRMRDASPLIESARKVRESMNNLTTRGITAPEGFISRLEAIEGKEVAVPAKDQTFKVDAQGVSERTAGRPASTKVEGGQVSVKDLNETRRDIAVLEKKARAQGDFNTADNLRALRDNIDTEFDSMIAKGEPGGAEIANAREVYRERYAPFFGEGAGKKMRDDIQRDDMGRTGTAPEKTAARFLGTSPDHAAASQDLARIVQASDSPAEGAKAVRDYFVASMARVLGVDGKPSLKALQKWRSDWSASLDAHPQVKAEVDDLVKNLKNNRDTQTQLRSDLDTFGADLRAADENAAATKRRVKEGVLSVLIGNDPRKSVQKIFNGDDAEMAVRDVKQRLSGNPEAWEAWRANVTDYLTQQVTNTRAAAPGGDDAVSFAKMKQFFEKNRATLAQVYDADEMNALQRVQKLLEPLTKQEFKATVGSATAERNEQAWRTLEAGLKAYYGVLKGGGVLRTLKLAAGTVGDDTTAVQLIVGKAMFDPELAAHLATRNVNQVNTPKWNAKLNRLLGYGEVARDINEDAKDEKDKSKK